MKLRSLATGAVAVGLLVTTAPAASATLVSASASIVDRKCSSPLSWTGGEPQYTHIANYDTRPRGTVVVCYAVYKFSDVNKTYDWYAATVETRWNRTAGTRTHDAEMGQYITSSKWAVDNDYGGTRTYTSNVDCSRQVDVGISAGIGVVGFSASTPIVACSGQTITRGALRGLSAGWYTPFAGSTPYVETAFEQKVTVGRPTYTFSVEIPRYTYKPDSNAIYRRTATTAWVTYKI
ncbi:hypothetical protein GCM10022415_27320 [Knoellia locipacati]|uniref:Uncharacterized protein n=1 Tax=Knoellia locipacati TaxID=882824 RepID=A0A512T3B0_9MICO|nr:hypothetical protein [Knoellia locipacati]GEQ14682.1 hypothetical protein KLO01_27290 [Knoellia locipacati]